ncbi:MAG TPA: SpoIIE family protein phosphatase [Terriglobia bacterium]|nr:SpoIIE family protein phosphatase [Terriglobia bacterium]
MKENRSRYNLFRILLLAGFLLGVALLVQTASTYFYVYRNLVIGAAVREADNRNQSLQVVLRGVQDRATAEAATATIEDLLEAWNRDQKQVAWIRLINQKGESLVSVGSVKPTPDLWSRVGRPVEERHSQPVIEKTDAGSAVVEIYGIPVVPQRGGFGAATFGARRGTPLPADPAAPRSGGAGVEPVGTRGVQPGLLGTGPGEPGSRTGAPRGPEGGPSTGERGAQRGEGPSSGRGPEAGGPRSGFGDPFRGGAPGPPPDGGFGRVAEPAPQRAGGAAETTPTPQRSGVTPGTTTPAQRAGGNRGGPRRGEKPPVALEIAIPLTSVSGPFASLRRTLIVGVGTSLALMASLVLIALRLPHHLRSQQIEAQLELARRVQTDLLAPPYAVSPQIDFSLECIPAGEVGGDFCDVFSADNGRVALILGDVSGKGISAALLMGLIHGALHSVSWTDSPAAHENATRHLNELLCKKTARERFSSLFWAYFDPRESTLHYINAGHLPPLLIRRRSGSDSGNLEVRRLEAGGTVLGLLPGMAYQQAQELIEEGDLLVIFSDGFSEAVNSREEEFGEDRMLDAIRDCWDKSAEEIRDTALDRVQAFIDNAPPNDDQTLIVARFQNLVARRTETSSAGHRGIAV